MSPTSSEMFRRVRASTQPWTVTTVVHCAGSSKGDDAKARHVVRAAERAGVEHLVFISVVGADRIPVTSSIDRAMFGYFAAKREAELIIEDSKIPHTTLRATQFHDFVLANLEPMAKLPVLPVWSGAHIQPVDKREVAARLAELALDSPAGLVPDIAGPRTYAMDDLARSYLRAAGKRRLIMKLPTPGKAAAAFRSGANLSPRHATGVLTWEEFLTTNVSAGSAQRVSTTR